MLKPSQSNVTLSDDHELIIERRDLSYGPIQTLKLSETKQTAQELWTEAKPVFLPGLLSNELNQNIQHLCLTTEKIVEQILTDDEIENLFDSPLYQDRLKDLFTLQSSLFEEDDDQGVVRFDFASLKQNSIDNLWCKVSWLSFHDTDPSLRFRFSFGLEGYEDVSQDPNREILTAELAECLFPESQIITKNEILIQNLKNLLKAHRLNFVERIVYFNAPNGGAQFHHDVERGHEGVIYAQLTGTTFWLALPKSELVKEVQKFFGSQKDICELMTETHLDQTPEFTRHLIKQGHGFILQPGDVILLPQKSEDHCTWHTVFTIGDEMGEALSFAISQN